MTARKIILQKLITEFERPMPHNDVIETYTDFLRIRDFLPAYEFNPIVFQKLVQLTCDLWKTEKKISRISLVETIKKYGFPEENLLINQPLELRVHMFELFKLAFEAGHFVHPKQLEDITRICNKMIINLELTHIQEKWLCDNSNKNIFICNRLLRYPSKSTIISNWIKDNYNIDYLRNRRGEVVSWILDQDSTFEIDKATLIGDFEYFNLKDQQIIKEYIDDFEINKVLKEEFGDFLEAREALTRFPIGLKEFPTKEHSNWGEVAISSRFYRIPMKVLEPHEVLIPDFERLNEQFYDILDSRKQLTMIWAIAYSRIDMAVKETLLQKYYSEQNYKSILKVAKRIRAVNFLKWMLERE